MYLSLAFYVLVTALFGMNLWQCMMMMVDVEKREHFLTKTPIGKLISNRHGEDQLDKVFVRRYLQFGIGLSVTMVVFCGMKILNMLSTANLF